jgi:hypothetical protein
MTKKIFPAGLLLLMFTACSQIPDVISKFQDGVNSNDTSKASSTISKTAQDYNSLANNNWSGLQSQIQNWRQNGNYTFSSLVQTGSGDLIDVSCNVKADFGTRLGKFQMSNDADFLFFKSWKIKKWLVDSGSGSFTNSPYLTRIK